MALSPAQVAAEKAKRNGQPVPKVAPKKKATSTKKPVPKKGKALPPKSGAQAAAQQAQNNSSHADPNDLHLFTRKDGHLRESSANALLKHLPNRTPQALIELQQKLLLAGYYGPNATKEDILWGQPDAATQQAYSDSLAQANYYYESGKRISYEKLLDDTIASRDKAGLNKNINGGGGAKISLTNPIDLKAQLDQQGSSLVGQNLSKGPLADQFVSYYHNLEMQASSGSTAAPSLDSAAQEFIKQKLPNQVQGAQVQQTGNEFLSLLNGFNGISGAGDVIEAGQ